MHDRSLDQNLRVVRTHSASHIMLLSYIEGRLGSVMIRSPSARYCYKTLTKNKTHGRVTLSMEST